MARPKERTQKEQNQALQDRSNRAKNRVKVSLATQLSKDIGRLLKEEDHADLTIRVQSKDILVHKFILKTRSGAIYERFKELGQKSEAAATEDNVWIMPDWLEYDRVNEIVRQLYTSVLTEDELEEQNERVLIDSLLEQLLPQKHIVVKEQLEESQEQNTIRDSDLRADDIDLNDRLNGDYLRDTTCVTDGKGFNQSSDQLESENVEKSYANECEDVNHDSGNSSEVQMAVARNGYERDESSISAGDVPKRSTNKKDEVVLDNDVNDDTVIKGNNFIDTISDVAQEISENNPKVQCSENLNGGQTEPETSEPSLQDLIKLSYSLSVPYETCSQLGEDLLRGFLQETDCDCIIVVSGTHFMAHRCILCARSSYFNAMLSGSWMESKDNEMVLEGITPGVMEQILLYMYGGVIELNETCLLGEFVMASDMYGIEGLKEVVTYTLTKQLCHFFHKPCSTCETGVTDALISAVAYNFPELKDKCIRWINSYMTKVWRTKSFASLPLEILDMCCDVLISELNVNNVLEVMLDCQKLNRVIPHVRWSEPALNAVTKVMDRTIEYTSQNFVSLLTSSKFADLDKGLAYRIGLLEEIFDVVIKSIRIPSACQVYLELYARKKMLDIEDPDQPFCHSQEYKEFIQFLFNKCENFMKTHIQQVTQTKGWDLLNKDVQSYLLESANFVCVDNLSQSRKAKPKLTSMQKRTPSEVIKSLKDDKRFMKSQPSKKDQSLKNPATSKKSVLASSQSKSTDESVSQSRSISSSSDQSKNVSYPARTKKSVLPQHRHKTSYLSVTSSMEQKKKSNTKIFKIGHGQLLDTLSATSTDSVDSSGQSDWSSISSVSAAMATAASGYEDLGHFKLEDTGACNSEINYEESESECYILTPRFLETLATDVELAEPENFVFNIIPFLDVEFIHPDE